MTNTNNTLVLTGTNVLKTEAGRHYHLFTDCRALAQGRRNSDKFGREIHNEWVATLDEALEDNMFGCRECHKRAGKNIPLAADRVLVYRERAAARAAAREAKATALQAKLAAKQAAVEAPAVVTEMTAPVIESPTAVMVNFSAADVDRKTQTAVRDAVRIALAPLFQAPVAVKFTAAA